MKAITLHQPWATLIMVGLKRFETRGQRFTYKGPLAIHASRSWTLQGAQLLKDPNILPHLGRWLSRLISRRIPGATCSASSPPARSRAQHYQIPKYRKLKGSSGCSATTTRVATCGR